MQKFVRVLQLNHNGFVEFQFSIGFEEMFVELVLPAAAFKEFCEHNDVKFLEKA